MMKSIKNTKPVNKGNYTYYKCSSTTVTSANKGSKSVGSKLSRLLAIPEIDKLAIRNR